ncbi:MAG: MerR family transcriptional regulator [Lachnospiraceae bacterium]|nr:MerR family transcriptional regulator [Lachnospiraceae bacterium]
MLKPEGLFYIHEIAVACGVSINALRFYEAKGLLRPEYTSPDSGYRYYSRKNLLRLRMMLRLKNAGLSLEEIKSYFGGNMDISKKISELEIQRENISNTIEDLEIRRTPLGDLTVREINLPERWCLCRTIRARDGEHAITEISKFYDELIHRGILISKSWQEFCEYPDSGLLEGKFEVTDFIVTACIPVDKNNVPLEAVRYPSGDAVAVNYRGYYYELYKAYEALHRYIKSCGYIPSAHPQEIYLEIDAEGSMRLDDPDYITRVIIPVKKQ